jgi:diaminopimelate decarboxylase
VGSWSQFEHARSTLANTWSTDKLFLQAHVQGYEESVAFCAYDGVLIDALYMTKSEITPEGKTWAGRVSTVPPDILDPLTAIIRSLRWTGGAELEMVREASGELWLLEWNPRFPAWIYGSTIAGRSLPALLVSYASGAEAVATQPSSPEFARVVIEIPVRPELPLLSPQPAPSVHAGIHSKHPSGMPTLAGRLGNSTTGEPRPALKLRDSLISDLALATQHGFNTPFPFFLPTSADANFHAAHALFEEFSLEHPRLFVAYSMKTNPDPRLLALARKYDLLIEVISPDEYAAALSAGWQSEHVILNGPAKHFLSNPQPVRAIFCDTLDELRALATLCRASAARPHVVGVRLRLPRFDSRFGVPLDSVFVLRQLARILRSFPADVQFGTHFHIASSVTGPRAWWQLCEAAVHWTSTIQNASSRPISCIDFGGGWVPDDWRSAFVPRIAQMLSTIHTRIPSVTNVIIEPGKALTQECFALATSVVEARHWNPSELVVDASIAELPQARYYPHPVLWCASGQWGALGPGNGRVLGRLCMEDDILASDVEVPPAISVGDILAICEAGAYDRSMSYTFGRGPR